MLVVLAALLTTQNAQATIVRFNMEGNSTSLGKIDVRFYDTAMPFSVANFLNYQGAGKYDGSFIHRSVPGFVIQGGGFSYDPDQYPPSIETDPPVVNEFGISNLRGTVAYAKNAGSVDSATSQFFFNLADNSQNLDNQNGGFTVFGRVLGDGMDTVDAIAALPIGNLDGGGVFSAVPVMNVSNELAENLVFISSVEVLDFSEGDYNFDGIVDALDYTVWRDAVGSTLVAEPDGNGDGRVDILDYNTWKSNFGAVTGNGTSLAMSVPEPTGLLMFLTWLVGWMAWGCRWSAI
jgi:peptidyl-prolyl cis-trans isomerase A (cyclophilin A)